MLLNKWIVAIYIIVWIHDCERNFNFTYEHVSHTIYWEILYVDALYQIHNIVFRYMESTRHDTTCTGLYTDANSANTCIIVYSILMKMSAEHAFPS